MNLGFACFLFVCFEDDISFADFFVKINNNAPVFQRQVPQQTNIIDTMNNQLSLESEIKHAPQ